MLEASRDSGLGLTSKNTSATRGEYHRMAKILAQLLAPGR